MALGGSIGLDITMAPGGSTGLSQQAVSHHHHVSSSAFLHNVQIAPILFLSHLSTIHLLIVVEGQQTGPLLVNFFKMCDIINKIKYSFSFKLFFYFLFF